VKHTSNTKRKIGLIVECGPLGADLKVFKHIITRLDINTEIQEVTLDNKAKLIAQCGMSAAVLLGQGCERVMIVWDLFPAWRDDGGKPCQKQDRERVFAALEAAGVAKRDFESPVAGAVDQRRVFLICIREELEAWLLADHQALENVLSRPSRTVRLTRIRHPEAIDNPKKRLTKIFKDKAGWEYSDRVNAETIIKAVQDLERLARACPSFARFAVHVAGKVW
jgi:hypothetical protein